MLCMSTTVSSYKVEMWINTCEFTGDTVCSGFIFFAACVCCLSLHTHTCESVESYQSSMLVYIASTFLSRSRHLEGEGLGANEDKYRICISTQSHHVIHCTTTIVDLPADLYEAKPAGSPLAEGQNHDWQECRSLLPAVSARKPAVPALCECCNIDTVLAHNVNELMDSYGHPGTTQLSTCIAQSLSAMQLSLAAVWWVYKLSTAAVTSDIMQPVTSADFVNREFVWFLGSALRGRLIYE